MIEYKQTTSCGWISFYLDRERGYHMAYKLDFAIKKFIYEISEKIEEAKVDGKSSDYLEGLDNALRIMLESEESIGKLI